VLSRPVGLEHRGVFLAITIAESLIAVVGMAWFRKGKWKTRQV
jgi:Na+-driven multidrug efflux pump